MALTRSDPLLLIATALLAALALAGCADRHAGDARAAQASLIGMPRGVLLSCAGAPDRMETAEDGSEYLTYAVRGTGRSGGPVGSLGMGGGSGGFGMGMGLGFTFGGPSGQGCVATFTVREGRITHLAYRDPANPGDACYAIVENCLAMRPPGQ